MRKLLGIVSIIVGILFLIVMIVLAVHNKWEDNRSGKAAAEIQDELGDVIQNNQNELTSGSDLDNNDSDNSGDPDGSGADNAYKMKVADIDGNKYIGILEIQPLELSLPIMSDWSYSELQYTPGCFSGTLSEDNLVICGHNYSRHFGDLKDLAIGDNISFIDIDGNVINYEVTELLTLQPTDVDTLLDQDQNTWDLTLYTCTYSGKARVVVRCSRID